MKTSSATGIGLATTSDYGAQQQILGKDGEKACWNLFLHGFLSQFSGSCPSCSSFVCAKLGYTLLTRAQSFPFQKKLLWISSLWEHWANSISNCHQSFQTPTTIRKNCPPVLFAWIDFLFPLSFFLLEELWSIACTCEMPYN